MSPTEALHKAVSEIQDVSETARRADMALTALLRLRRGEALDIRISTLARLAQAMGRSADELLGLREPPPNAAAEAALRRVAALMEDSQTAAQDARSTEIVRQVFPPLRRRSLRLQERHYLVDAPDVIGEPGFHRGRDAESLVDAGEVVIGEVKRHGGGMVLDLL